MQGSHSSVSTLPENLIFDNGSTSSSDAGIDSEISWNNMPIPAQNPLPEYRIPSSGTHNQYLQHSTRRDIRNAEWCLGETSSSARQYQPHDILSSDNVGVNPNGNQTTNGSFLLQSSSSNTTVTRDLNMSLEFEDQENDDDDDCWVIERPSSRVSVGSSNDQIRSNGGYPIDESEDRPGCSLDGRRVSCKRKALDMHAGPSSGIGSSIFFQNAESRQWLTIPENNVNMNMMPMPAENNVVVNNGPEQANNGLRLGVGRGVSSDPFSFAAPGNLESSRRNIRLRINNGLHQQDPILPENPFSSDVGNLDVSSPGNSSRLVLCNRLFDSNPENGSLHGQSSLLDLPSVVRRNHQSRWSGASGARSSRSFGTSAVSEEGNAALLYEEPTHRTTMNPMGSNSSQTPTNWNLSNNSIAGNFASRAGSSRARGESSSAPGGSHRSLPQYPRRLSELVRRSLLADRGINHVGQSGSFGSSQEMGLASGPDNNLGRHVAISRSGLLERERHLDGASGIPYSWRTLAAASEGRGRSSVMSEQIRHVLDLMRRGEGLRFEDVMVLDHSVLFGMADIHDRHRDMRLDVDNMSYEELLALEDRIGNVCTGLTEETILSRLKQRKFVNSKVEDQVETEPCSICREEYNDGEDLGTLECGHDFHKDCIKQWLMHKNLCPICKTTGLTT